MTAMVEVIGLLRAALYQDGAQTQRPRACVVIGGALAIMPLTRVPQAVLIYLCRRKLRLRES
jgi:Cu/Ag efflux pump CusA